MGRSNRRFHTFDSGTHEWIGTEDENKGGELEGTSYSKTAEIVVFEAELRPPTLD